MKRVLSQLYGAGLIAAACFLALIGLVVLAQIVGRIAGIVVPSADDVAAFSMAASLFLGLAATLRAGVHVRVEVLLTRTKGRLRIALELFAYSLTGLMLAYLTWYTALMTWDSFTLGGRSPGLLAIPLWIPQTGMTMGLALMAVACLETTVSLIRGRGIPVIKSVAIASE
jgi:TRAP-type C4-dicarboxylate transport system permease small subunit